MFVPTFKYLVKINQKLNCNKYGGFQKNKKFC